jgi:beta-glucanase (GH16 family)
MAGYSQTYVNDFTGTSLPSGWDTFSGNPGGDPGAQWAATHVVVSGGLIQLNTWQDSAYGGEWVAGGICQCGQSQTYGAYFVRSRLTGAGPTGVQLLWPVANVWPPEIDFNESGGTTTGTSATVHWSSSNSQDQRTLKIDMTQWHTWGVVWTPTTITYTVDGQVWGTVANPGEIPSQAMTLDLDQQTWCASGFACPTAPQSELIDWVAEYTAK